MTGLPRGFGFDAYPDNDGILHCPACRAPFARTTPAIVTVATVTLTDTDGGTADVERAVPIGARAELEPGYVNAPTRHPSGWRWFIRGKEPSRPSPKVRLPAVVTCRCGREIPFDVVSDRQRAYSTNDEAGRASILDDELADQGFERYVQMEIDLRRGK